MKIGLYLYDIIWKIYSLFAKKAFNILIYPRNSYAEKTIKFLKSDIDYTAFYNDSSEVKNSLKLFKLIRIVCPLIGEANIYSNATIVLINTYFINAFEIGRDKELVARLSLGRKTEKKPTSYEALAFLVFNALNDIENLKKKEHPYNSKWINHLKRIEQCFVSTEKFKLPSLVNFKGIISVLVRLCCIAEVPPNRGLFEFKLYTSLEIGLNSISSEFRNYYFSQHQWLHPDLISFFPEFYSYLVSKNISLNSFQTLVFIERMKLAGLGLVRSPVYYDNYQVSFERLSLFLNLFDFIVVPSALQNDVRFLRIGFLKAQEHLSKLHSYA